MAPNYATIIDWVRCYLPRAAEHRPKPAGQEELSILAAPLLLNCRLSTRDHGAKLLELLCRRFTYYGESRWREQIGRGLVKLNGLPVESGCPVAAGDVLTFLADDFREPESPAHFEKVLETDDLLLIGKPAGMPVTRTGLIVRRTLVNILRSHYRCEVQPLHRLDRETSGLVLCAKHREAARRYHGLDRILRPGKYYLALTRGRLEAKRLRVNQPLATRADSAVRCRMWPQPAGKPCRTRFDTVAATDDCTLLLAELETGRRHQIRAHLAHLGHPLVGDKIYSHGGQYYLRRLTRELDEDDYQTLGAHHHLLHAWGLRLQLPDRPAALYFSNLIPDDFLAYLKLFPGWCGKARRIIEARSHEAVPLPRP